jgi:WD40 repeat protein
MRGAVWVGAVAVLVTAGPAFGQQKKPAVLAKLEGHRGGVSAVAISAQGDRIATGAGNGDVRVWDAKTAELIVRMTETKHGPARVAQLAFSAAHNGRYLSASSRNNVVVWDVSDPKRVTTRYEDPFLPEPSKLGTVTGDGKLGYFTSVENNAPKLQAYSLVSRAIITADLPPKLKPLALAPISDPLSGLVAIYCAAGEKGESASVALVGVGETQVLAKDVPPPQNRPISIGFAPDAKWLVVGNGSKVSYWRVPGSQVITGDPKSLAGEWYVAAAGPRNRVAVASVPESGKTVTVKVFDVGGTEPKSVAEFASGIERVSVMAFAPDGSVLAVADDVEGVLQLWALDAK